MRIESRSEASCPWYLKPFFWRQRRKYGKTLDAALLWARSPKLFLGVATLYGMIDRRSSPIDPALRSLITVRVSQINGCRFCVDPNSATLLQRGASLEQVAALRIDPQGFCELPQSASTEMKTRGKIENGIRRRDPERSDSGSAVVRNLTGAKQWKN